MPLRSRLPNTNGQFELAISLFNHTWTCSLFPYYHSLQNNYITIGNGRDVHYIICGYLDVNLEKLFDAHKLISGKHRFLCFRSRTVLLCKYRTAQWLILHIWVPSSHELNYARISERRNLSLYMIWGRIFKSKDKL